MPDAAKAKTLAGAQAFVTHYYALVAYGNKTDDWEPLKSLSYPSCADCRDFWSASSKRRLDFSTFDSDDPAPQFEGNNATIDVAIDEVEARRSPQMRYPPQWVDGVELIYKDGQWMVEAIDVDQSYP
jgi:hypothetical protein